MKCGGKHCFEWKVGPEDLLSSLSICIFNDSMRLSFNALEFCLKHMDIQQLYLAGMIAKSHRRTNKRLCYPCVSLLWSKSLVNLPRKV